MDMLKYRAQKGGNKVELKKTGPLTVAVISKQFDTDTGAEIESKIEPMQVQGIKDALKKLQEQRVKTNEQFDESEAGLTDLLADVELALV